MGELLKLLYVVVVDQDREDNNGDSSEKERCSFRYTRSVLQSTLQFMGCKPRHAFKISRRVFEDLKDAKSDKINNSIEAQKVDFEFELYKRKTTVIISRETFINIVCNALSTYKYVGPNQREDLILACRIRERKESITILLCGTSGCGKSTLSALLGHRLGITTVVSTDSIRHMMRSFVDANQNPLLWASTYHAGDFLDPIAVAQSKAKKKAKKMLSLEADENTNEGEQCSAIGLESSEIVISKKQMAIEGYKAQSEMVIDSLDRLITCWENKKESVIIEGVHLSLNFVMGLMQKHPSIIPFMLYISNESKHSERFAIRAKYMTLDPSKNKYIKYIKNIRTIQEYLLKLTQKYLIPKINNTNIDKSMASIHATIFATLKIPDPLYDTLTNTLPLLNQCFKQQCEANYLSSKGMFQLIQRLGSSRHLMALVNDEGVVEKAWPIRPKMDQGPLYGPVGNIGSFEEVNLQFGGFGISAWPSDVGSVGSVVGNGRIDTGIDRNRNKGVSSCSGSPKNNGGAAKELVDKISMSSEEEQDLPDAETDEDLSDNEKNDAPDDMEGSVDEDSTKTDEEYEDLEYLTDDENMKNSEDLFVKKNVQNSSERKMRIRRRSHSDASKLNREKNLTKSLSLCK